MGEDIADRVDDLICAWDKVVGTELDTLVMLLLGGCKDVFLIKHDLISGMLDISDPN